MGKGLYLIEDYDGENVIVKGGTFSANTCLSGAEIVPTYENCRDSTGRRAEYVLEAEHNDSYIIARTANHLNSQRKFILFLNHFIQKKIIIRKL